MTIENKLKAQLTVVTYKEVTCRKLKKHAEQCGDGELLQITTDVLKAGCDGMGLFFARIGAYVPVEEVGMFNQMVLLYHELVSGRVRDEAYFEAYWATNLPDTFNYLHEERGQ